MHYYPKLETVEDMSSEELLEFLKPLNKFEWWMCTHLPLLWRTVKWNWFNVFTGEESFWLFLRHGFREWGSK